MGSHAEAWLVEDESAREMLDRVLTERPFLLLPPFHRVPLRVGNIVELVGPSYSAKTHILMQAAITCILPKEWKGVNFGGLGHLAMFLDLDCRFDILRFSELLNHRIMEATNGSNGEVGCQKKDSEAQNATVKPYNEELFALCMRRFLYIRCYDSSEFLATLKTLHYRIQREKEAHGTNVHFLLIDSIGAFHWVDRGSSSFSLASDRKSLHLESVSNTVVQEIRKLLLVHPMLVMATKAAILGNRYSVNELRSNYRKWPSTDNPHLKNVTNSDQQLPYRECMPAVWQSFVTHRILVRATDDGFINVTASKRLEYSWHILHLVLGYIETTKKPSNELSINFLELHQRPFTPSKFFLLPLSRPLSEIDGFLLSSPWRLRLVLVLENPALLAVRIPLSAVKFWG